MPYHLSQYDILLVNITSYSMASSVNNCIILLKYRILLKRSLLSDLQFIRKYHYQFRKTVPANQAHFQQCTAMAQSLPETNITTNISQAMFPSSD
jgi:hypothetical protein